MVPLTFDNGPELLPDIRVLFGEIFQHRQRKRLDRWFSVGEVT